MQEATALAQRPRTRGSAPVADRLAFRVRELSELSGVSEPQLYIEIAAGRLKATRKGRLLLILRKDALEWLETPTTA